MLQELAGSLKAMAALPPALAQAGSKLSMPAAT